jgi:hypothetical protein
MAFRFNPSDLAAENDPMKRRFGSILLGLAVGTAAVAQPAGSDGKAQPGPADSDEIVLSFRGHIAGSEQIKITRAEATWHHRFWNMPPGPVTLNGISWNPREQATLKNEGKTRFLARPVDFQSARLERIQVRDTVALEAKKDSVIIHVNDSLLGEGAPYEFRVVFRPPNAKVDERKHAGAIRASLRIVADIDGSDVLYIDAQGARWVHRHWQPPEKVYLNKVAWVPQVSPTLKNEGPTRFLNGPVDGGLVIYFVDSPFDRSTYEVAILFGD